MSEIADFVRFCAEHGMDSKSLKIAQNAFEETLAARREKTRLRMQKHRAKTGDVTHVTATEKVNRINGHVTRTSVTNEPIERKKERDSEEVGSLGPSGQGQEGDWISVTDDGLVRIPFAERRALREQYPDYNMEGLFNEALEVGGFARKMAEKEGKEPQHALHKLKSWIKKNYTKKLLKSENLLELRPWRTMRPSLERDQLIMKAFPGPGGARIAENGRLLDWGQPWEVQEAVKECSGGRS